MYIVYIYIYISIYIYTYICILFSLSSGPPPADGLAIIAARLLVAGAYSLLLPGILFPPLPLK